jgi:hypothetical protein
MQPMSEKNIQSMIMLAASQTGAAIFRNNSGNGVAGAKMFRIERDGPVNLLQGDWVVRHGSRIQYGLTVGSSDLIGWRRTIITPDMVGKPAALFLALEVKTAIGKATPEQINFIAAVRKAGGLAGIVRSVDEALGVCNPLEGI